VRLYGLKHLGSEDAAGDLAQRVLMVTLHKLRGGEVREPQRIASFILGTARMVTHELRREGGRAHSLDPGDTLALGWTQAREPIPREKLGDCIEALPERERSVIVQTFFQEDDAATIARALSIQAGNVRVIRHRAVLQLRDCLGISPEELA
jgi:RNA polymerase sigma-70 factor (ECF subfamily)